jgi:capsular exopolysaccharide synthesis family protein
MALTDSDEITGGGNPEVNMRKYLLKLLRRWPYILLFFLACLLSGFAYNRYLTPIYGVTGRITTRKYSNKPSTPVPGLVDASFFLNGITEIYEEIPILKSPARISAALDKVDFTVNYYSQGTVKTVELPRGFGFDVEILSLDANYPTRIPIFVNHLSATAFVLKIENTEWQKTVQGKQFTFGVPFVLGGAKVRILNSNGENSDIDKHYFIINRKEELIAKYSGRLQINWTMLGANMMDLYMETELPEKDIEFMRAFYQVVEEKGLEEKNQTLENTIRFIEGQMRMVSDSLNFYQSLVDDMKLNNRNVAGGSDPIYAKLEELDQRRAEITLNERYFEYLTDYFNRKSEADVFAPSLIGLNIPLMEGWVNQYISQKLTEKTFRNSDNFQNPLVNRQDSIRKKLVWGIFEAMNSARERNKQLALEIGRQEKILYASVSTVQNGLRNMERSQRLYDLNYTLFDLLIKRKTEAAISKASATSDYKVIDEPSYSHSPIKPDKKQNLAIAAILGLLIPIGFFLGRDLTNSRIMDKDDLNAFIHLPLLGNVAHSDYATNLVVKDHPRSVVAESFRAVRANLKYLTSRSTAGAQLFTITSSIGGEGKTFCSINLAYTLALTQKKVIMVGADLRKPELANYLGRSSDKGLSAYLAGYATINELILPGDEGRPDFIDAGKIPPNPSELLGNERMSELITFLKGKYDYIIIDTPPIGLVSDVMELFKYANYNVLIVRQGVTPKAALKMVSELHMEGKIQDFTVLFNDIELIKRRNSYYGGYLYGMGYSGYGFGYYEEDDKKGKRRSKIDS